MVETKAAPQSSKLPGEAMIVFARRSFPGQNTVFGPADLDDYRKCIVKTPSQETPSCFMYMMEQGQST